MIHSPSRVPVRRLLPTRARGSRGLAASALPETAPGSQLFPFDTRLPWRVTRPAGRRAPTAAGDPHPAFADRVEPRIAVAAGTLYLALTLWFLWPLPSALSTHLLYARQAWTLIAADADFVLWAMAWTAYALLHDPLNLFDANIFYPMPNALALSDHMLGHQPIFAPVFLASGNPVLAGNVLLVFHHWLAALGAFLLAGRLLPAAPALAAGAAFAFLATRRDGLIHPHVLAVGWMPLVLFFADRWLERARRRDGVLLSLCLGVQLLSSFYLAYMMLVGWMCALPVLLWRWRDRLDARRMLGGLAWCALAAVPFLLASIPYVLLRRDGYLPSYGGSEVGPGRLVAALAQNSAWTILVWKGAGPVALGFAFLGLVPPWRGRRGAIVLAVLLVAGGYLIGRGPADLTLGFVHVPSPYRLMQVWVPGFSSIRVPDRILTVAALGIALLAGLGVARLLALVSDRPWVAWLAATGVCAAIIAFPSHDPDLQLHRRLRVVRPPPVVRWLATNADGRPLLELPPTALRAAARRMLASTAHWLPLFDGYTSHPPPVIEYLARRTRELPERDALAQLLRETDVGWILLHWNELPDAARTRWQETEIPPELELVGAFGDDRLFRVAASGPMRHDSPLCDPTRTLDGNPPDPLGPRCPGRLEILSPAGIGSGSVLPAGSHAYLRFRLTNDGDRPWPGSGLHPKGQVRLRACIADPAARVPCGDGGTLLLADVAPHESLEVGRNVGIPKLRSEGVLWADLVQIGVGPLSDCGVAPLALPVTMREHPNGHPTGSYWMSCRACTWDGGTLACECLDGAGQWTATTSGDACAHGFLNRFGKLDCEPPPGSIAIR